MNLINTPMPRVSCLNDENPEVPDSHLFLGVWGAWMTFKKPDMDKTLKNGLSMSETDPLNHTWLDFAI